uniref:Uncharacterized protein n=1 Tax=Trichuris muris TaxID=70415 RepID=A0A5S6R380_TRIMR
MTTATSSVPIGKSSDRLSNGAQEKSVRVKRTEPGFGWLNPLFMDTNAFPLNYPDIGNVHFWTDGWLLPTNTYAYRQTASDYYLMDNMYSALPGLSDNPNILGNQLHYRGFFPG